MIKIILKKLGLIRSVLIISIFLAFLSASISSVIMIIAQGEIELFGLTMSFIIPVVLSVPILAAGCKLALKLDKSHEELLKVNEILEATLAQVKELSGLVPICASCKKIRDDDGFWNMIETYIEQNSKAKFSHSICPECAGRLYPGIKSSKKNRTSSDSSQKNK